MLRKFKEAKGPEIEMLTMQAKARMLPAARKKARPSFIDANMAKRKTGHPAVIAEFKQASPSCGDISLGLSPEDVAKQYTEGGASCISVLTEEKYFKGDLAFLHRMKDEGTPLLRKDFIFHPLQVMIHTSNLYLIEPQAKLAKKIVEIGRAHV